MRRIVLAVLALASVALAAPAAHAAPIYDGGCSFHASTDPTGEIANQDNFNGVIHAEVVAGDDDPTSNPASVSVTCILKVNGTIVDIAGPFTGVVEASGADDTSFVAIDGDTVELCRQVIVNGNDEGEICVTSNEVDVPPKEFWNLVFELDVVVHDVSGDLVSALLGDEVHENVHDSLGGTGHAALCWVLGV